MALAWDEGPAWWQADKGDKATRTIADDGTTYRIFHSTRGFELWVWSGRAEVGPVLGAMGADLRSQKRAKQLATYDSLDEAKAAADAIDATGEYG